MELYIAGGCTEHGRNCFYVRRKKMAFLVDCGLMKENPAQPLPLLSKEQIASARYLFLTHCPIDHTGARLWLYENGFRGKVILSAYTLEVIPGDIRGAMIIEKLGAPGKKIELSKELSFVWGRSGHCIGSVWLEIEIGGKETIFFSGDACAASRAFRRDPVKGRRAGIAVLDCAYGEEETDAADHLRAFSERMEEAAKAGELLLFPVPFYGRGFDILRFCYENGIPVYADSLLRDQFRESGRWKKWLKKGMLEALKGAEIRAAEEWRAGSGCRAVLLADSQLAKEENRETAMEIISRGGQVILTGKQEPASFSKMLLSSGKASFYRISVHMNVREMKKLAAGNSFRFAVPYHCRQELKGLKKKYVMLKAGERFKNG